MKIFNRDNKINFVDSNNVFVGYDFEQSCCESFGYIIDRKIPTELNPGNGWHTLNGLKNLRSKDIEPGDIYGDFDTKDYYFHRKFIQEKELGRGPEECDCESIVSFKLLHKTKRSLYLTLFNCHNGYYSHGFQFKIGDKMIKLGYL